MSRLWRCHHIPSGIVLFALDGKSPEVVGMLAGQSSKCLHSVALNRGSWEQGDLFLEEGDPQAADALPGTAREVEDIYKYQKAYKTLRHKTSAPLESSGSEDAPDATTQKKKKSKKKRRKDPAADTPAK